MKSNFERFHEIQKQGDSESYSSLCHVEPRNLLRSPYLGPKWSGPLRIFPSEIKSRTELLKIAKIILPNRKKKSNLLATISLVFEAPFVHRRTDTRSG